MDFNTAAAAVIQREGGFQNDPRDRGNWTSGKVGVGQNLGTKYGISAMAHPDQDIANLTIAQAKAIYKAGYWDPVHGDDLPDALRDPIFDMSINAGPTAAIEALQHALGVPADGVFGPVTSAALSAEGTDANLVLKFYGGRLLQLLACPPNEKAAYLEGWVRRVAEEMTS